MEELQSLLSRADRNFASCIAINKQEANCYDNYFQSYARAANRELLAGHDPQIIAASSLTYNIGVAAYNRSTVARRFSAGDWRGACDAFLAFSYAGGRMHLKTFKEVPNAAP